MKALLITGTLAEATVKQYAKQSQTPTEILTLNVQVAAFLNPQIISQALKKHNLKDIDILLTPGQILGDTKTITDATKIPSFKGPRYAADLPVVLDCLGDVTLSTFVPADDLLRQKLEAKALAELEKVEQNREELLKKSGNLVIGGLAFGKGFPMRVLAEIVDAPLLDTAEIVRLAKRYVASGAHIIDVGMVAGQTRPQDAKRAVVAVKAAVNVPVSIDTLNPVEIEAAVAAGVDLVLSADAGNMEAIAQFAKDVAIVIIPTNQRRGLFPKKPAARVKMLERLIKQAKQLGFKKIIGDLILEPTNILDSYVAFQEFNRRNPDVPLLIGIANVVELFDADSVGLNALLARLASEVSADILLTTEKTPKARGCVREVSAAAKMMFLAKKRDSVPRDLGLDLLILKEKVEREMPLDLGKTKIAVAKKQKKKQVVIDPCGVFRVMVDRESKKLVALHYNSSESKELTCAIRGLDAEAVMAEVLRLGLVSRLEHAAYLGGELAKAEVALRVGRDYVQDADLFEK
ncbi:MAG: dihydropteroate synthase-like protein [Candidatus Bathyarchaeota archaeon]|nr:dihydropteroate synthase-like protein [Candidatus Bathyarchaeota archaeon]